MSTEATMGEKIVETLSSNGALSNNKKVGLFVVLSGQEVKEQG